jgi:hypothetical protein
MTEEIKISKSRLFLSTLAALKVSDLTYRKSRSHIFVANLFNLKSIKFKINIRFIRLLRWYINITITILDIIHRPVFYLKLNSTICLSVPHRKHITSPLQAQQVNAIYRFVTMVY